MSIQAVHIISFDIPYPTNYGGVIDVFYQIQNLARTGIKVHLHCFKYGRKPSKKLEDICKKVYYYPRKTGIKSQLSLQPYIVKSRQSESLIKNLLKNNYPIIFEGMHTIGIGLDHRLNNRIKIYRSANIEHHYYHHLAKAENNISKKIFFYIESYRLKKFEKKITHFDIIIAVSNNDKEHLKQRFPHKSIHFIPCFHENNQIISKIGKGNYALYNANLGVAENTKAVNFLIDKIFSKTSYPFIISGLNPPKQLIEKIKKHENITLKANVSDSEMHELIVNAQFNTLITFQATGLKLKLLNTLFKGRFCIVNSEMVAGTSLSSSCFIAKNETEIIDLINKYKNTEFTTKDIEQRKQTLSHQYNNTYQAEQLIKIIEQALK